MNINDATLQDLEKTLNAKWTAAFTAMAQPQLLALATRYTSTTASNFYAFLEAQGGWSEWNGARQFKDIASQQFEVKNKDYEMSIKMGKNELMDDQIGMYVDIVPQMVEGWFKKQVNLVMDVLKNNPLAYDGVALFSNAGRSYGDNVIDNYGTDALSATNFGAARVKMMEYLDHAGDPLAVNPDTLVVGPYNEKAAFDAVTNYFGYDGTNAISVENFYKTTGVRVVVAPQLVGSYQKYWFLADTTDVVKGVLLQIREVPSPLLSSAQEVARSKTVDYMADGRMAAAAGAPHKIYGSFAS